MDRRVRSTGRRRSSGRRSAVVGRVGAGAVRLPGAEGTKAVPTCGPGWAACRLSFVANQGRWDARASWVVAGRRGHRLLPGRRGALGPGRRRRAGGPSTRCWSAPARPRPTASVPAAGVVSYFGADTHAGMPTANELTLAQAWPGVDVTWSGTGGNIEATYRLAPGADPAKCGWRGGERSAGVTDDGRLAVTTPLRTFEEDAPKAFQDIDGRRVPGRGRLRARRPRRLRLPPRRLRHDTTTGHRPHGAGLRRLPRRRRQRHRARHRRGRSRQRLRHRRHRSRGGHLPGDPGGVPAANGGGSSDAFVAKVNPPAPPSSTPPSSAARRRLRLRHRRGRRGQRLRHRQTTSAAAASR